MSKRHKVKSACKICIVILSLTIIFFLMLPFLEGPTGSNSAASGKKAIPQIFTSNPLSDLVRKVYNMFARNHSARTARTALAQANGAPAIFSDEELARFAAEQTAKDPSSTTSANVTYDYGEAGIISEDGDWILVRQTVPDAAQPGMHEISTKENAYERYVRQERAAKHLGASNNTAPAIPDSKWARLWKPIKNFFSAQDEVSSASDSGNVPQALLASAGGGKQNYGSYSSDRYRKASLDDWANSTWSGPNSSAKASDDGFSLIEFLSEEDNSERVFKNLRKMGESLSPKNKKQFNNIIKRLQGRAARHQTKLTIEKDINQKSKGQTPQDYVAKTLSCENGVEGLCHNGCDTDGPPQPTPKEEYQKKQDQQQQEAKQLHEKYYTNIKNFVREELGEQAADRMKKMDMLVVLEKTTAGEKNPLAGLSLEPIYPTNDVGEKILPSSPEEQKKAEQQEREIELTKEFYDFVYREQGCDKQDCYWVGAEVMKDESLRHTIEAAGVNYMGDPLKVGQVLADKFQTYLATKKENQTKDLDQLMKELNSVGNILENLHYYPYNPQNMEKLKELTSFRNPQTGERKKPQKPHIIYTPTAAQAKSILEGNINISSARLIYGENGAESIKAKTPLEARAQEINQALLNRIQVQSDIRKRVKEAAEEGFEALLKLTTQDTQERFQKSAGASLDSQMGL